MTYTSAESVRSGGVLVFSHVQVLNEIKLVSVTLELHSCSLVVSPALFSDILLFGQWGSSGLQAGQPAVVNRAAATLW